MKIKDFKQFSELEEYSDKPELFWSVRISLWGMVDPSLEFTSQEMTDIFMKISLVKLKNSN